MKDESLDLVSKTKEISGILADGLVDVIVKVIDLIAPALEIAITAIITIIAKIIGNTPILLKAIVDLLGKVLTEVVPLLVDLLIDFIPMIVQAIKAAWNEIQENAKTELSRPTAKFVEDIRKDYPDLSEMELLEKAEYQAEMLGLYGTVRELGQYIKYLQQIENLADLPAMKEAYIYLITYASSSTKRKFYT